MKKKALVASILTIALCLSLIAGSTFALFTSESTVNVAVTSGKVNVTAIVDDDDLTVWSTLGTPAAGEDAPRGLGSANMAFTATTGTTNITLTNIVPGDYVEFPITIHNESNVTVKYRTVFVSPTSNALFNALKITVVDPTADAPSTAALTGEDSASAAPTIATPEGTMEPGCDDIVLLVRIELPETVGNELQEKNCTFSYKVEAVQGNGEFPASVTTVSTVAELRNAIAANDGKKIVLAADIDITDAQKDTTFDSRFSCMLKINKSIDLDLNGHTIEYSGGSECGIGLLVEGNATLNLYDSSNDKTGTITGNDPHGLMVLVVRETATANVYGGNFKADGGNLFYKISANATLNFCGGKVEVSSDDWGGMFNVTNGCGVITISGGSFKKFQPGTHNPDEVVVAPGYKVVQEGDWYNVVPE